jgi:hypothetical protein
VTDYHWIGKPPSAQAEVGQVSDGSSLARNIKLKALIKGGDIYNGMKP